MVRLIWISLSGLLLGALAWWTIGTESYVLIRVGDWAAQLSLWGTLIAIFLLWFIYVFLRALFSGFGLWKWRRRKKEERVQKQIHTSFQLFYESRWKVALKSLLKLADRVKYPAPYQMLAARAAAESGELEQSLKILSDLEKAFPDFTNACALERTRIYTDFQQTDKAMEQLQRLRSLNINPVELDILEAHLAASRGDMQSLEKVLKNLGQKKRQRTDLAYLERFFYQHELSREDISLEALRKLLRSPSDVVMADAEVVERIVRRMQDIPADAGVEILTGLIEKHWTPKLIGAFGDLESSQPRKQLKRAERWHQAHLSSELLETLQKLAWRAGDSGLAREYAQQLRVLRKVQDD